MPSHSIRALFALLTIALCLRSAPCAQQKAASAPAPAEEAVARAADAMRARLVERRRDFHMHPELSNREERTARIVAERLRELGLDEVRTGVGRHGVVGLLRGGRPGPVVAVRADMDALPIQETIDVPYKSRTPGVKHACGHDAHTTIGLGVAEILAGMRDRIPGTVKFVFQPAEEGPPAGEEGGARLMVKEGALENPRPAAIFGLHAMPAIQVGQIAFTSGPAMASADRFVVTVRGKQAHGAAPHLGVDTVLVAAECVTALQSIRSRRVDPQEPIVLTVGSVHGGNRFNILADEVKLEGTVRTLNEDVRRRVVEMMRSTLGGVTAAYGATYELEYYENAAVTFNDPALVEETLPALRRAIGTDGVRALKPQMIAEDFSYYQQVVPGFFYFLGVGNEAKGITASLHTPEFDLDEESLVVGVRVMTTVVLDYLERHAQKR
jgi:amidohydrolase